MKFIGYSIDYIILYLNKDTKLWAFFLFIAHWPFRKESSVKAQCVHTWRLDIFTDPPKLPSMRVGTCCGCIGLY